MQQEELNQQENKTCALYCLDMIKYVVVSYTCNYINIYKKNEK